MTLQVGVAEDGPQTGVAHENFDSRTLAVTMFDREPATREQVFRRILNDVFDRLQTVVAPGKREFRFVPQLEVVDDHFHVGYIGRIAR